MNRSIKKPLISRNAAWIIFVCGILISVILCVLCVTVIDRCGCWADSTHLWEFSAVPLVISFASVFFLKLTKANTIGLIGILIIIMFGLWFYGAATCGACIDYSRSYAYNTSREELQGAVKNYQNKNGGALPMLNGTVNINGSVYHIVDVCLLLESNGGILKHSSDCLWSASDDNCNGSCEGCDSITSYIWAVDENGILHSTCVGQYCNSSGVDGYQGWP